ncbi:hypothetical protein HKCCE3408_03055 [Rhodobacterales bacterium HKCCE3408]|nr:hypothetical protein [Rhodobacterales bacterium HKCCE3408]
MPAAAQAQDDDQGRIVRWIQDALSTDNAIVRLEGFRGALSSQASLDRLTVADQNGVWITVENVTLNWNRAALLRGRVDISAFTAEHVVLDRLPEGGDSAPAPEAQPFSLPDLPVSIEIDTAELGRVDIGEPVFGEAVSISAEASVTLSGGAGQADMTVQRVDGGQGEVTLSAAYDNATTVASINLAVVEGPGGLAVSLLGIEGEPDLRLTVAGEGPLDDFAADFALATEGQDRLAGSLTTGTTDDGLGTLDFELAGDLTPVVSGDADVFLGTDTSITARAIRDPSGAITVENLSVRAAAVTLDGSLSLDAQGQPEAFELTGGLAPPGGDRLALPGGAAELAGAEIDLSYDRARGDAVTGRAVLTDLATNGFEIGRARLDLDGTIARNSGGTVTAFTGDIALETEGMSHVDPDIATALGDALTLDTVAAWRPQDGVTLSDLSLRTASVDLDGEISADPGDSRLDIGADLTLSAGDIAVFGGLVDQSMSGAVEMALVLQADALSGAFDADLDATTTDIRVDGVIEPGLLAGTTTLNGGIERDATGITLREFTIDGTALSLDADGRLATDEAALDLTAALTDLGLVDDRLEGPVSVSGRITRTAEDAPYVLPDLSVDSAYGSLDGDLSLLQGENTLDVTTEIDTRLTDLAGLSAVAGMPLDGSLALSVSGRGELNALTFDLDLDGQITDLRVGDYVPEGLLDGTTAIAGGVERDATGFTFRELAVDGAQLGARLDGRIGEARAGFDLTARLSDLALVEPSLSGPVSVRARLDRENAEQPYEISGIALQSSLGTATGSASVLPAGDRIDVTTNVATNLPDLSAFSEIAGMPLTGAVSLRVEGSGEVNSLTVDADITGELRNVSAGDIVRPGLLSGLTTISGGIARDGTDFAFRDLRVEGTQLGARLDGTASPDAAALDLSARITDLGLVDPRLDGPASLSARIDRADISEPFRVSDFSLDSSLAEASGSLSVLPGEIYEFGADLSAGLPDLSRLSEFAGTDLGGALALDLDGTASIPRDIATLVETGAADIAIDLRADDIRAGTALPRQLLAGRTTLTGNLGLDDGTIRFDEIALDGREVTARLDGTIGPEESAATLSARLRDAQILTPILPGAVSVEARVTQAGSGPLNLDAEAAGPGGLTVDISGEALRPDGTVNLALTGQAPLGLANSFIAPRSLSGSAGFDLTVRGEPSVNAVSGRVTIGGARLAAPTLGFALEGLNATADISGGSASLNAGGTISTGGQLSVNGTIGFARPGLPANLQIALDQGRFVDPALYEANVERARLTLSGALAGSSQVAGDILLGTVEIRVPESGVGGSSAIPEMRHTGESTPERRTRAYAGLLDGNGGNGGGGSTIGLDITVTAPGRIFVRGRGLDAELGGTVRIGGTTANIVPSGRFELVRGRLSILGQRLDFTRGSATLQGGDPILDLTAQTQSGEYTVFVDVSGPASSPEIGFRSAPDLPEDEVLAQLFFGRSASSLSPVQALQLADAVAGLAGGGSGIFTRLREGLGLDNLDIQSDDEGNAIVSAGRYLTDNIYTDVTVDNEGTGINLNIDLTPDITARGGVNSSGESSLGIFFERDY